MVKVLISFFLLCVPAIVCADNTIQTATSRAQERAAWGLSGQDYGAQTYIATINGTVSTIKQALRIGAGSPSDKSYIEVHTGSQSGTLVSTSDQQSATASNCAGSLVTFTFSPAYSQTVGTTYYIVLKRSGALSGSNYYSDCGTDSDTYANGNASYYDGTWHDQTSDRYFEVYEIASSGSGSSATTTVDLINAYTHFYVWNFLAFVAGLCGTLYIWRRVRS